MSNTDALGHNYQTYGVWTIFGTTNSGKSGTFSTGMVTQDAAIPRAGSATYTGTVIGDYIGDDNTAAGIINGGIIQSLQICQRRRILIAVMLGFLLAIRHFQEIMRLYYPLLS